MLSGDALLHRNDLGAVELTVNTVAAIIEHDVVLALGLLGTFDLAGSGDTTHVQGAGGRNLLAVTIDEGELDVAGLHLGQELVSKLVGDGAVVLQVECLLSLGVSFLLGQVLLLANAIHNSEQLALGVLILSLCHNLVMF